MGNVPENTANFQGKKVFFVHPSSVIQKDMVSELIKNEYEIYLIPDYRKAKALFRKYPDCIVFINIDEGMKEPEWEVFIKEVQEDIIHIIIVISPMRNCQ